MPEDVIKVCVDKEFTRREEALQASAKAINENPENDPLHHIPVVGLYPDELPLTPLHIAAPISKKWRTGRTLRVLFLDGDPRVQSKVEEYAKQWEQYANINFQFGSDPNAEIQISFQADPGSSWSWMGTDNLSIPPGQPTMNYGWLTMESTDEEYLRVVLHEFGHALGCIHEHQHPDAGILWDKPEVYRYYMGQLGWSKEDVDSNLFARYDRTITNFSGYDRHSIMHYALDNRFTLNDYEVGWNTELSSTDKRFIGSEKMYPFQ